MTGTTSWKIRRAADGGFVAIIRFRTGDGPHGIATVSALGAAEGDAIARAAVLANQLASSPIFNAVAPPGTAAAIRAISAIAKSKDVQRTLSKYAGPGARRLAKAIRKFW
jgi:hypothetical protein